MKTFKQFSIQESESHEPTLQPLHPDLKKQFEKHHATFTPEHHEAISAYKHGLGDVNVPLRNKRNHSHHETLEALDHVTSNPLTHELDVYRGHHRDWEPHKMPVGHEHTDRGYTGTTLDPEIAKRHGSYNDQHRKVYSHIHLKSGDKGHYLDQDDKKNYHSEKEFLISRGTRYKVLGHSEHPNAHVVHLGVVSQANHEAEHAERKRKLKADTDDLLRQLES
jgi:hypothetical protein